MTTTRKQGKHADKDKKKIGAPSKTRSRPKLKDEVCVLDELVFTERITCCDDECCCPR
jgi:hypothetical protein